MRDAFEKFYRDHWVFVLLLIMIAGLSLGATLEQVNTTSPQTLTNKTLTTPTLTNPNITGTVTGGATYSGITLDSSTFNDVTLTGTVGGSATYTTPTLSSPNWTGTATGTLTGGTLASPTIQGTIGAGTGLTMPAFTAGGNITGSGAWQAATITTAKGGTGLTTVGTANQVLGMDSSAAGLEYKTVTAGSTGLTVAHTANTITLTPATDPFLLENFALAATVSSNSLFINVKGADGNDPSASNAVRVAMRHTTQATGTYTVRSVTSALTFELSAGSTLGATGSETIRFYVYLIDNDGTLELAMARQALFDESVLHSTTAEGGAGGADSTTTLYSSTARTSKPVRLVGVGEITSAATAGNWDTVPSVLSVWKPGMRKTGDLVQRVEVTTSSTATTTSLIPSDNTIPQNTEGAEFLAASIIPTSSLNRLEIEHYFSAAHTSNSVHLTSALFQDSIVNAISAAGWTMNSATANNEIVTSVHRHTMLAGTTVSTTFRIRMGADIAGTLTYLGRSSGSMYSTVDLCRITIREFYV